MIRSVVWKWFKGRWTRVESSIERWSGFLRGMTCQLSLRPNLALLLIACSLGLSGCGGTWKPPLLQNLEIGNPCPAPPRVDALVLRPTPPTATVVAGASVILLTPRDYDNLAKNQQDILLALRQQNSVISYYKRCIDRIEKFKVKAEDGR